MTGGAGFIGSALVRHLITKTKHRVLNIDKLTYAGNLDSLSSIENSDRYFFKCVDICNKELIRGIFSDFKPDIIVNLAAESHVDRSIDSPSDFLQTNIIGTFNLLEQSLNYYRGLDNKKAQNFRFHHVSTDEVYGDLGKNEDLFTETSRYKPSSPYSASKASSDHLVRSWGRTYDLPILITNCSNNYGPYQFPEKLIPHMIISSLNESSLPIYGSGNQIRDWLHVQDHVDAIISVALNGKVGQTYNIGGKNELKNIEVVNIICETLNKLSPSNNINSYSDLITYVQDRPGHDLRYAIDASKISKELDWSPKYSPEDGISQTVRWYLENRNWWQRVLSGDYKLSRLGRR